MPNVNIFERIVYNFEDVDNPSFELIQEIISSFQNSGKREFMLQAQDYYNNFAEIENKEREYFVRGVRHTTKLWNNAKLHHPFLKQIVDQKVNFLLSKEFTISTTEQALASLMQDKFLTQYKELIYEATKEAVIKGSCWIQTFFNADSELDFKIANAENIIPFFKDDNFDELQALIKIYNTSFYMQDGNLEEVTKIEYYTENGVKYFVLEGDEVLEDRSKPSGFNSNFEIMEGEDVQGVVWNKIPFIQVKYNKNEIPLLYFVKSLIDEYNVKTSEFADALTDIAKNILVVKGYKGTEAFVDEFIHGVNKNKTIFMPKTDDTLELLRQDIAETNAIDSHLNRLRKDIFEFSNAVDMQEVNVGNRSGEALKFIYSGLELDADGIGKNLQESIKAMVYFLKQEYLLKNGSVSEEFLNADIDIIFNKDLVISERDISETILRYKPLVDEGLLSRESLLNQIPFVGSYHEEQEIIEKENMADGILENSILDFSEDMAERENRIGEILNDE